MFRIIAPEASRECFWLLSAGFVNGGMNVDLDAGAEREDFGVDDGVGCDEFSEGRILVGIEITMNVSTSLEPITFSREA